MKPHRREAIRRRLIDAVHALQAGDHASAESTWAELGRFDARDADELLAVGRLELQYGDSERAANLLRRAAHADDTRAVSHLLFGIASRRAGGLDEAEAGFRRALDLQPENSDASCNLAMALEDQERHAEALVVVDAALPAAPDDADLHNLRGSALCALGRTAEGVEAHRTTLRLDPRFRGAELNLAQSLLQGGQFDEGWRRFEARRRPLPPIDTRQWRGEPLDGRTVLAWHEQGLGDTIQFARYLPLVRARGGHVVLRAPAPLARLMGSLDGCDVVGPADPLPRADLHCPLLSLPGILHASVGIPSRVPYLQARGRVHDAVREAGAKPRVGLTWAGNPKQEHDARRSLLRGELRPVLECEQVELVGLQFGEAESDLEHPGLSRIGNDLADFDDLGATIAALDLLITVDTAAAHLAGALGRPAWVLLRKAADWRWGAEGETTEWYPTLRLFRQHEAGDWSGVIAQVRDELEQWARTGFPDPIQDDAPGITSG